MYAHVLNKIREKISPLNPLLLFYHRLIAIAAALFYGFPARRMKVIAVTGSKGKSTVIHMLANILQAAGFRVGVVSTIHFQIGETIIPNATKMTTQGRFRLQELLREMVKAKCEFAILEATSQALIQSRLWGVNVDTAVLTNMLRDDHIEVHGGFENYMHAKGLLFAALGKNEKKMGLQKTAVLPSEDPHIAYFEAFFADRKISYGMQKGMIHAGATAFLSDGSRFTLQVPNGEVEVTLALPGEFNIRNALAAAAAAISFGVKLTAIQNGLQVDTEIPGRLEMIRVGQPFTVVVDYAHSPDALEKVLALYRPLTKGKLYVVFGSTGGGRDKEKRPLMGAVAAKYADFIVVTDDDPYTEDRMQIIEQIAAGTGRREGENLWLIRDRRQAIRLALSLAKEHDTVLVAGKGCEPIQIVGEERIEWDDRKVVREILGSEVEVKL